MTVEIDPILEKIDRFLARHSMLTPTELGLQSVSDPALVTKLRKGRELRRKTRAAVEEFMRNYKNGRSK